MPSCDCARQVVSVAAGTEHAPAHADGIRYATTHTLIDVFAVGESPSCALTRDG